MITIEKMLAGQIEMPVFVKQLKSDLSLQASIRELIPREATGNPSHELWQLISYSSLHANKFDFIKFLHWICRFDGTISDNLNIFGTIQTVYLYHYPDVKCTTKYYDVHGLYLDVIKDCFDGPEVRSIVDSIINDALKNQTKKKRVEQAKQEVRNQFHISDNRKPRWIQGPEWPCGTYSPMRFVSQKRQGEQVQYSFEDVDTYEKRIVTQYY